MTLGGGTATPWPRSWAQEQQWIANTAKELESFNSQLRVLYLEQFDQRESCTPPALAHVLEGIFKIKVLNLYCV